uniref:Si:dkey-25g12.4 n=1 Tax=Poecilia latipinna TaxID=48699 RepID=A0A3B3UHS7_9TELE
MAVNPRITAVLPPAKTVTVYRNGDAFYPGKKVVLNPRHLSTFDNFMNTLTRHMEAPFGAVRRLYTPTEGHSVQELAQLKHGGSYVAAGNEPFKIKPVPHTRVVASSRWRKTKDGTCTINVFSNGELRIPPARVRIPKHTLKSWDRVLTMVTHKVELRTGAVYKLCRLDGRPVSGSSELENNQHYVAKNDSTESSRVCVFAVYEIIYIYKSLKKSDSDFLVLLQSFASKLIEVVFPQLKKRTTK